MALVRMTEKKLAASRANAQRSKGPTTPAGKEKVSRNACKHHLYARKFPLPSAWQARIWDIVKPCAATIDDPAERASLVHYFILKLWVNELFAYETRLLNQSIARHRNFERGVHDFVFNNPLFLAISTRSYTLARRAESARKSWERAKHIASTQQTILHLLQNAAVTVPAKPLTMAAAAGSPAPATPTDAVSATLGMANRPQAVPTLTAGAGTGPAAPASACTASPPASPPWQRPPQPRAIAPTPTSSWRAYPITAATAGPTRTCPALGSERPPSAPQQLS